MEGPPGDVREPRDQGCLAPSRRADAGPRARVGNSSAALITSLLGSPGLAEARSQSQRDFRLSLFSVFSNFSVIDFAVFSPTLTIGTVFRTL